MEAVSIRSSTCRRAPTPSPSRCPDSARSSATAVEVSVNFTSTIDAEMRVGAVEETITVTGESPIVDIQSAAQTRSVTAGHHQAASRRRLVDSDGRQRAGDPRRASRTSAACSATRSARRCRRTAAVNGDGVSLLDGLRIGNMYISSNLTNMSLSPLLFDQVDVQLSGQSGETGTNGVIMNAIPRSGGNTVPGRRRWSTAPRPSLQGSNITDRLEARGVAGASTTLKKLFDINGAVGGPIKQDKLWFYFTSRYFTNEFYLAGLLLRARPDGDSPRRGPRASRRSAAPTPTTTTAASPGRINDKQKFTGWYAYQYKVDPHWTIAAATTAPEAVRVTTWHTQLSTFKWTYTATQPSAVRGGHRARREPRHDHRRARSHQWHLHSGTGQPGRQHAGDQAADLSRAAGLRLRRPAARRRASPRP